MPSIELVDTFADDSLEMDEDGHTFRVAQALQDKIAANDTLAKTHAARHADGGPDELSVAGLSGLLADPQTAGGIKTATTTVAMAAAAAPVAGQVPIASSGTAAAWGAPVPAAHKASHQDGGADEIVVTGLSGKLADAQTPLAHKASHQVGGADEINVTNLTGRLKDPQTASMLWSGAPVSLVDLPPTPGQVLTATGTEMAAWVTPVAALVNPAVNGFRLAPTADDSIPADGSFSTIYLAPVESDLIALYTGAWALRSASGLSYTLAARTTDRPFDLFAWWDTSGTPAVKLEAVDWSGGTARATALVKQNGVWVKSGDPTRRYLGTVRPRSATTYRVQRTQSFDLGVCAIDLWNVANRRQVPFALTAQPTNWNYSTATWRQAAGNGNAQIELVAGLASLDPVSLTLITDMTYDQAAQAQCSVAIGLNNVASLVSIHSNVSRSSAMGWQQASSARAFSADLGVTKYLWCERGTGAGTLTWHGSDSTEEYVGMIGTAWY